MVARQRRRDVGQVDALGIVTYAALRDADCASDLGIRRGSCHLGVDAELTSDVFSARLGEWIHQAQIDHARQLQIQRAIGRKRGVAAQRELRGLSGSELGIDARGVTHQLSGGVQVDSGQSTGNLARRADADGICAHLAFRRGGAPLHVRLSLQCAARQQIRDERIDESRLHLFQRCAHVQRG